MSFEAVALKHAAQFQRCAGARGPGPAPAGQTPHSDRLPGQQPIRGNAAKFIRAVRRRLCL